MPLFWRAVCAIILIAFSTSAHATVFSSDCGEVVSSIVSTDDAKNTITSVPFVDVPGASATFTIPAGSSGCIKLKFFVETECNIICAFQALLNGKPLRPALWGSIGGGVTPNDINANAPPGPGVFEWHRRLRPGTWTISIQGHVGSERHPGGRLTIVGWTLDAELTR